VARLIPVLSPAVGHDTGSVSSSASRLPAGDEQNLCSTLAFETTRRDLSPRRLRPNTTSANNAAMT
jgi:hypothetical protein